MIHSMKYKIAGIELGGRWHVLIPLQRVRLGSDMIVDPNHYPDALSDDGPIGRIIPMSFRPCGPTWGWAFCWIFYATCWDQITTFVTGLIWAHSAGNPMNMFVAWTEKMIGGVGCFWSPLGRMVHLSWGNDQETGQLAPPNFYSFAIPILSLGVVHGIQPNFIGHFSNEIIFQS